MTQSAELTKFYRDYLAWVESGAPEHPVFDRDSGLCLQINRYTNDDIGNELADELENQFIDAGLCDTFPFNGGGVWFGGAGLSNYLAESSAHTCHLNEARMAWVRDHIDLLHVA